jgi:hypothetical protein
MVRPSKGKTNLLCIDVGHERKEQFANCLPRTKSITEALKEYMDSVIAEQKKEEALDRLPILNASMSTRQSSITEYDIKLFQIPEERMNILKQMSKEQKTKVAIEVTHLRNQIDYVRR